MLNDALAGLTVVDFSQGIAGPNCACLLGDLGARVIKIEPPEGDWARGVGARYGDSSVTYKCFNRGKLGVMLDLKDARAREAACRLTDAADVFVESSRPGVAKRLGIDYGTLKERNPRLIYVSVTGFGQTGPYGNRPATDTILQALTGFSIGVAGSGSPMRVRVAVVDVSAGVYAGYAALAAVIRRARTGTGEYLDINLMHAAAALQGYKIAEDAASGGARQGELFAGIGIYATQDGYLALSAIRDAHVVGLLEAIGRTALIEEPRFSTLEKRLERQDELREEIACEIAKQPTRYWLTVMSKTDLLYQEVLNYSRFREDPQAEAVCLFEQVVFDGVGPLPMVRPPGAEDGRMQAMPSPLLGQHTREVLLEAGVASSDADELAACAARARAGAT
jgi:crotonobetainyl-CoA:carnitine CoA-transferase CaiB-like acyl-CoA transferase